MAGSTDQRQERYRAGRRVTLVSVVVNTALSVAKFAAGLWGNSAAMVADAVHSFSDLVTDGVVLLGLRIARREADEDHPYGHGKFETLATEFIALALLAVAVGIVYDAVVSVQAANVAPPRMIALVAAIVSIVVKEALYQYTVRVGRRWDSKALIANAWHHRSDAVSSVAAFIGIGGALLGVPVLDPIAAIAVAFILGKVGVDLLRDAVKELTDSTAAIDQKIRGRIVRLVESTNGIRSAHFVNARRLGPDIHVDVHVVVDPFLSVSEGHQIADKVRLSLVREVDGVADVMVHVDPLEVAVVKAVPLLADRAELTAKVDELLRGDSALVELESVTPHYTAEGIVMDVVVAADEALAGAELRQVAEQLCRGALDLDDHIVEVRARLAVARVRADRSASDSA